MAFKETRKSCPTCAYSWLDKYGKNECPKCLAPLAGGGAAPKRMAGEASTFKSRASDAGESASGSCPNGGPHEWKYGKCNKCQAPEGGTKGRSVRAPPGGACSDGNMHVFKFSKCTKCGKSEF